MSDLQKALRAKEQELFDAEGIISKLENDLRLAKTGQAKAEAESNRLKRELTAMEERLQKSKRSEKEALTNLHVLRSQSAMNLKRLESNAAAAAASPPPRAQSEPVLTPQTKPSASPTSKSPKNGVNEERLLEEQRKSKLWKLTAQVVLESYKTRLDVTCEEKLAYDAMMMEAQSSLRHVAIANDNRLQALQQQQQQVNRLSELDEAKRMDQFHELTTMREKVLVIEREKAVLDREMVTLDKTVVELQTQVRQLEKERRSLAADKEDLSQKVEQLSSSIADLTTGRSPSRGIELGRDSLLSHSELRAELSSLKEQITEAAKERDEAQAMLKKSKEHFEQVQEKMRILHAENSVYTSTPSRAQQRSPVRNNATPHARQLSPNHEKELRNSMHKMSERLQDLEELVKHKDQALQLANYQLQRQERSMQRYSDPTTGPVGGMRDPYSRGMRVPSARSPSRTTSVNSSAQHPMPFRL